jgi:hypothetical protein
MDTRRADGKSVDKPPVPLDDKLRQALQLSAIPLLNTPPRRDAVALLTGLLLDVGKLRDGFLVGGGALYVLGYIIWSLYASESHLGLVSAFQSQYLLAGILALVPVVLIYFVIQVVNALTRALIKKRMEWFNPYARGWKGLVRDRIVSLGVALIALWGLVNIGTNLFHLTFLSPIGAVAAPATYAALLLVLFFETSNPLGEWYIQLARWMINIWLVFVALAVLALYIVYVYPAIPQELGGAQPRCAYLDLARDQTSDEVVRELGGATTGASAAKVARTGRLEVVYSGGDSILARIPSARRDTVHVLGDLVLSRPIPSTLYELKRSAVQAITWCDAGAG